jgi:SAM-dependent methyltransferase
MNAFRRFTTSLGQKGVKQTARLVVKYAGVTASRVGDIWFDIRYGTDTSGIIEVDRLQDVTSPNKRFAMRYEVTRARPLRRLLRRLDLPTDGVFVDIGCGKGRVLMVAAGCGFTRLVGVEYSRELCEIARDNLSQFRRKTGLRFDAEVVEADAVDYDIPPDANVFFMFNPFYSEVLEMVAWKIARSVGQHPRKAWLIYLYPECRAAFDASSAFAETGRHVWGDCEFVVYESVEGRAAD